MNAVERERAYLIQKSEIEILLAGALQWEADAFAACELAEAQGLPTATAYADASAATARVIQLNRELNELLG